MSDLAGRLCFMVVLCTISFTSASQVYENTAGTREKLFVYRVKQIEEFFERFNDDPESFIRRMYKSYGVRYNIDRSKLIQSLFNYETNSWQQSTIDSFVRSAIQTQLPSKNHFYGENWYAEAKCRFEYNGSEIDIPVILRIVTDERRRSKWMIAAVKSNPVKSSSTAIPPRKNAELKFIHPASHSNYFVELEKIFDDKENLAAYFDDRFFVRNNAVEFYNSILENKIRFMHVKEIKYHFLQVNHFIFTVEYFPRQSLNAGWLINSVKKAAQSDKESFRRTLLEE